MTRSRNGIRAIFAAFGLLLVPQALHSQQAIRDSWQEEFVVRLDQSLTNLRADVAEERSHAPAMRGDERPEEAVMPEESVSHILALNGLPAALIAVVDVESAFDPQALSPKGARGLWQLMPATARRYGLKVELGSDERVDPLKSTRAAAAYLKDLYGQFQDWPLALAAYNAGEVRVAKALSETGANDFWTLRRRGALPDETSRYVPAVLQKLQAPLHPPETPDSDAAQSQSSKPPNGRIAFASLTPQ